MGETLKNFLFSLLILGIISTFLLSGCNMPVPQQLPGEPTPDINLILTKLAAEVQTESVTESVTETASEQSAVGTEEIPTETPAPTATPEKLETLTVCLGKEPASLFFYAESSQAMWSVLESIYNGPFDFGDGLAEPVIFEDISIENKPVTVIRGDIIVDFDGDPVELKQGVTFMPAETSAECIGKDCLLTWGYTSTEAEILQSTITFKLKDNLFWNDGTPLTAEDSVYSMTVNGMKGINASKRHYNLTESYTAADEHTVVWKGIPGYLPADPSDVFWTPLPGHVMKGLSAEDLLRSENVNSKPLGWGAWQISSWEKGSEIIAERNPYYVSADGTEPFFDRIVYKFYGRPGDNSLEALESGSCDIIDTSADLVSDLEPVLEDVDKGKKAIYIRPELTRQEIVFNLQPSAAQWNVNPLANAALRTALTRAVNRKAINRELFFGQSEIPVDFYPADYSVHNKELEAIPYDPEAAKQALDEMGWTIPEDNPNGTRIATAVTSVMYGTELSFKLTIADTESANKAAEMIQSDLAEIGVKTEIEALPLGELYAQGPDGVIFGRKFDTVMFAWSAGSNPCGIYVSGRIPNEVNHWVGTNVGSYENEDYDQACLLPGLTETDAGQIFAEELPVIPLYFNINAAVSANNICGINNRIGSRSVLWNMEQFSRSETSCAVSQWVDIYP